MERTGRRYGLRTFWKGWKRVAKKIGDVQARLLLTVFYFVVLAPFALVVQWCTDPLGIKPGSPRGWRPRSDIDADAWERARRLS
jgi:hypothetical protein